MEASDYLQIKGSNSESLLDFRQLSGQLIASANVANLTDNSNDDQLISPSSLAVPPVTIRIPPSTQPSSAPASATMIQELPLQQKISIPLNKLFIYSSRAPESAPTDNKEASLKAIQFKFRCDGCLLIAIHQLHCI